MGAVYGYMRENIKVVENINIVLNNKIDDYLEYFKDEECMDREALYFGVMEFMLEIRTQNNLLKLAVDDANRVNEIGKGSTTNEDLLRMKY